MVLVMTGLSAPAALRADSPARPPAAPTRYDMLLSSQDVERVCGFGGIRLVPKDPNVGATSILNFALPHSPVILTLTGEDLDVPTFAKQKESVSFRAQYAYRFRGLGEDAYVGPAQASVLYVLSFQQSGHWITLSSGFSRRGGKPFLSLEQLRVLARLILERL
jgi:hypothetical protein